MTLTHHPSLTVSDRLDALPATRHHWRIVSLSGIGWAFDAMDVGLVSFALVSLGRDWGLDKTTLGLVASIGFLGMFIGAAGAGRLADRYGRRTIFMATILVYSVATLLSGVAWGLVSLLLFRFQVGVGLGSELPVASTLVSEIAPARSRGRMLVLLESFWARGWVLAAVIGLLVVPRLDDNGWRAAFVIGALPACYAVWLRRAVPESPRYLAATGRHDEAEAIVRDLERAARVEPAPLAPDFARQAHDGAAARALRRAVARPAGAAHADAVDPLVRRHLLLLSMASSSGCRSCWSTAACRRCARSSTC